MNKSLRPVRNVAAPSTPLADPITAPPPTPPTPPPTTVLPRVLKGASIVLIVLGISAALNSAWLGHVWLPWLAIALGILQVASFQLLEQRSDKLAAEARARAAKSYPQLSRARQADDGIAILHEVVQELTSALDTAKRATVVTPISPGTSPVTTQATAPNPASDTSRDDEAQRIRGALDITSTNVMIADAEGYIRYGHAE